MQFSKKTTNSGFTLVEVIISVAILAIMSSIFLSNRSSFSRSVNLSNIAHDVSIVLQQAQSYGTSNRGSGLGSETDRFAYGVNFNLSNRRSFQLFRDANNNQRYDAGAELIEEYTLPESMRLWKLCLTSSEIGGERNCSSSQDRDQLTVMFRRPNPDAFFYSGGSPQSARFAGIIVEFIGEGEPARRAVVVGQAGFITVR